MMDAGTIAVLLRMTDGPDCVVPASGFHVSDALLDRLDVIAGLRRCSTSDLVAEALWAIPIPDHRSCELCGAAFIHHDQRQRYCSEAHANHARYQRRRDRKGQT